MENLKALIQELLEQQTLVRMHINTPRTKESATTPTCTKVGIRPLMLKGKLMYQITSLVGKQSRDKNVTAEQLSSIIMDLLTNDFKQAIIQTPTDEYHILISKKQQTTLLKKQQNRAISIPMMDPINPVNPTGSMEHNRKKHYLLEEGYPVPFLVELGVMNPEGKVYPKKYDKFRQINRFLEMIDAILPELDVSKPIRIIDFGCGKSYLTFALYEFLAKTKKLAIDVIGLDLKKEVIERCQKLTEKLGYEHLHFFVGDIEHYELQQQVDLVVVLHACDVATDAALNKAVGWGSDAILAVPCCQHELFRQIHQPLLEPILKHGILRERFAALATDALRAQWLEVKGYKAQVMEFIDMEHTPKNLLIRAVRRKTSKAKKADAGVAEAKCSREELSHQELIQEVVWNEKSWDKYVEMQRFLGVSGPSLLEGR